MTNAGGQGRTIHDCDSKVGTCCHLTNSCRSPRFHRGSFAAVSPARQYVPANLWGFDTVFIILDGRGAWERERPTYGPGLTQTSPRSSIAPDLTCRTPMRGSPTRNVRPW